MQDFMQEPSSQVDFKTEAAPQMEYGYQASPAKMDFRQDENNYGYENYGYENTEPASSQPTPAVDESPAGDYGYENYGYENHSMDDSEPGHPEESGAEDADSTSVEPVEKSHNVTNAVPALEIEPEEATRALSPPASA
jgi:hypothetical protein